MKYYHGAKHQILLGYYRLNTILSSVDGKQSGVVMLIQVVV